MSELKRCPLCGGEAEFYRTPIKTNGGWCDRVVVRCKVCEARTNRVLYDAKKHPNDKEYEEAAKAWNTRKPIQNIVKRLEETKTKSYVTGITSNPYEFGACHAMNDAIKIVKEEGGLNEN